jgi:hypothetical protein
VDNHSLLRLSLLRKSGSRSHQLYRLLFLPCQFSSAFCFAAKSIFLFIANAFNVACS